MTDKTMDRWRQMSNFFEKIKTLKKGMSLPVQAIRHQRGKDITAETLQFRFTDSCNGKCGAVDRR